MAPAVDDSCSYHHALELLLSLLGIVFVENKLDPTPMLTTRKSSSRGSSRENRWSEEAGGRAEHSGEPSRNTCRPHLRDTTGCCCWWSFGLSKWYCRSRDLLCYSPECLMNDSNCLTPLSGPAPRRRLRIPRRRFSSLKLTDAFSI